MKIKSVLISIVIILSLALLLLVGSRWRQLPGTTAPSTAITKIPSTTAFQTQSSTTTESPVSTEPTISETSFEPVQLVALEQYAKSASFYRKLAAKEPVRVLVLGDSIAWGEGSTIEGGWITMLTERLQAIQGGEIQVRNDSAPGAVTLYGYHQLKSDDLGKNNDLVIVCLGENDRENEFELYYEAILRNIRSRNPESEVICVLESSQRDYTAKIKSIQKLSDRYKTLVLDAIDAFAKSGQTNEQLTTDGTHPNDVGYQLYADRAMALLRTGLEQPRPVSRMPNTIDDRVTLFDHYRYWPLAELDQNGQVYATEVSGEWLFVHSIYSVDGSDYNVYINHQLVATASTKQDSGEDRERFDLIEYSGSLAGDDSPVELEILDEENPAKILGITVVG